jgi:CBS domain-containing protein
VPRVKDEMVRDPVAAHVPAPRSHLLALFLKHRHAALPVVKEGTRKLVGLVTRHDLFDQPMESQVALLMNPNATTTYPEAPVREAARLLVDRRLRVLPVVSGANDLLGVLTPREALAALPPPSGHVAGHLDHHFVPVHQGTPVRVAFEILRAARVEALPVLDDDGRYAGLLGDGEIRLEEGTLRRTEGPPGEGDAWTWEAQRGERQVVHAVTRLELPPATVRDLMATDVPPIGPNANVRDAIRLVVDEGQPHLPVVAEDGRIVDLLGAVDLVRAALGATRRGD